MIKLRELPSCLRRNLEVVSVLIGLYIGITLDVKRVGYFIEKQSCLWAICKTF